MNAAVGKANKPDAEWKISETKLLLDKVEQYLSQVGPMKKFKTKRIMWKKISADLKEIFNVEKTYLQCENRYKTILKRKKKATDNNNRSGSTRETIEYEEELRKIYAVDDSLEPEVLRGVTQVTLKESADVALEDGNTSSETVTSQEELANSKKKGKTIADTLVQLQQIKEDNKERRHQEKMDMMKELLLLLKKD